MAQWTESVIKVQNFGMDGWNYKIMVEKQDGTLYFVWYPIINPLESEVGDLLVITFHDWGRDIYWDTITNPNNGRESNIDKVLRVN